MLFRACECCPTTCCAASCSIPFRISGDYLRANGEIHQGGERWRGLRKRQCIGETVPNFRVYFPACVFDSNVQLQTSIRSLGVHLLPKGSAAQTYDIELTYPGQSNNVIESFRATTPQSSSVSLLYMSYIKKTFVSSKLKVFVFSPTGTSGTSLCTLQPVHPGPVCALSQVERNFLRCAMRVFRRIFDD